MTVVNAMGWKKAQDQAWRSFGQRYWKVIVGFEMARKTLPAVLGVLGMVGLIAAGFWAVERARTWNPSVPDVSVPAGWMWWAGGGLAALVVLMLAVRRARRPYRMPSRPGAWKRRLALLLVAAGAVAAGLLWRAQ